MRDRSGDAAPYRRAGSVNIARNLGGPGAGEARQQPPEPGGPASVEGEVAGSSEKGVMSVDSHSAIPVVRSPGGLHANGVPGGVQSTRMISVDGGSPPLQTARLLKSCTGAGATNEVHSPSQRCV